MNPSEILDRQIDAAVALLRRARSAVAVTGAGISAESGIPTFRDSGGFWEKYPPEEYATYSAFRRNPKKIWTMWRERSAILRESQPNPGHYALAELETAGWLKGVITQNVDNLHQDAGSQRVVEFHGNARRMRCKGCGHAEPITPEALGNIPPKCACGAIMKPDVVMFEEWIPEEALAEADALTARCDAMLIVGTSAQVYPAADLPRVAKNNGASIIEVNIAATEFTDTLTDVYLEGASGEVLPFIAARLQGRES